MHFILSNTQKNHSPTYPNMYCLMKVKKHGRMDQYYLLKFYFELKLNKNNKTSNISIFLPIIKLSQF